jgi:hypothetical protein
MMCDATQVKVEDLVPELLFKLFVITDEIKMVKVLGRGGFGEVWKGLKGVDGEVVAVKKLIRKNDEPASLDFLEFRHEVSVMRYQSVLRLYWR